jgi:hypothetical protein
MSEITSAAAAAAAAAPTREIHQQARRLSQSPPLRGLRDLHRLSPQARQTILALRPHADASAPSAASLAFIETGAGTQAELPTLLSDDLLDSIEALSSAKPGDGNSNSGVLEDPMGDLGQE